MPVEPAPEAATQAFPTSYATTPAEPFVEDAATQALPASYAVEHADPYVEDAATQAFPTSYATTPAEPFVEDAATQALPASYAQASPSTQVLPVPMEPGGPVPMVPGGGQGSDAYVDRTSVYPEPAAYPEPPRQARPEPRPAARPEPRPAARPERLPPEMRAVRRRTAALPVGTILLLASVALLGWGVYTFLTSIDVLNVISGGAEAVNWPAAAAVGAGAVLAFCAVIAGFVAVSRARPKTAAWMLLLGAFVLPLASTAAAAYYGGTILKDRTLAEAQQVAGQVDTTQAEEILNELEARGVPVPWRDELLEILHTAGGGSQ